MNAEPIHIVIFFVVASLVGGVVMRFAAGQTQRKYEALRDHVNSRSWRIEQSEDPKTKGRITEIRDPQDNWTVISYFNSSTTGFNDGANTARWTEWKCEVGSLKSGAVVLGPALPDKTIKMLNLGVTGPLTKVIKSQLFQLTRNLGDDFEDYNLVESKEPNQFGTVLASPGNEDKVDSFLRLELLKEARESKGGIRNAIVYRNEKGMGVRLRNNLSNAKELDEIVKLGIGLRDKL